MCLYGTGEERMQQIIPLFNRFRFVFAGLFVTAFLIAISNIVTMVGANSILTKNTPANPNTADADVYYDSSNAVTALGYRFSDASKRALLASGKGLYNSCKTISTQSTQVGKGTVHGTATAATATIRGAAFAARGIANITLFGLRTAATIFLFPYRVPGKVVGSIASSRVVSNVIRPADDQVVPVISRQTSAEALAHLSVLQQQEIAKLQADQLTANEKLEGTILEGDPNHGGYPAKWDYPARQDSTLDAWGMYNRECVSYTAWKVHQTFGTMPYWGGVGNANEWPGDARRAGIPTSSTPKAHSVAISRTGYYGHAMWVEKVDGDMIYISQYNYDLHGHYSEMWLSAKGLTYIYFE
jgi:surface antigen